MFYKTLLLMGFLVIGTTGYSQKQTVQEVVAQISKQYSAAAPLQYASTYTLYKNATTDTVAESYQGIFSKNAQNDVYTKINGTEILNTKTINIKISPSEKAIQIGDPLPYYFDVFDLKSLLEFCTIDSFKELQGYWEITLVAKNYSSLPYSRIVLQVSKTYFIQKSIFYYSTVVNFSKDYRAPAPHYPRLEVSNSNFSRKEPTASLFKSSTYLRPAGNNKYVGVASFKNYEVIDQRTISNP